MSAIPTRTPATSALRTRFSEPLPPDRLNSGRRSAIAWTISPSVQRARALPRANPSHCRPRGCGSPRAPPRRHRRLSSRGTARVDRTDPSRPRGICRSRPAARRCRRVGVDPHHHDPRPPSPARSGSWLRRSRRKYPLWIPETTAEIVDGRDDRVRVLLHLVGRPLDEQDPFERVDRAGMPVSRQDLLRQGDLHRRFGRQPERLVHRVGAQAPASPSTPAIAWYATRTMLFRGCCSVSEQPAVWTWSASTTTARSSPNRLHRGRPDRRRSLQISSKNSLWALKKKDVSARSRPRRGPGSSPPRRTPSRRGA